MIAATARGRGSCVNAGTRSLLDFIQTPVMVGDPDGRVVYVNPAFETDFLVPLEEVAGQPVANLFAGGGPRGGAARGGERVRRRRARPTRSASA